MGRHLDINRAVLVFSCLFLWRTEDSQADSTNLGRDAGSSEDSNQNYFFYQQSEYPRDCHEVLRSCSSFNASGVYVIKPDGYPEPFEVYCENDISPSGWTVVQRRMEGHTGFNRLWHDFKDGFGFSSTEFWLGNEKLSYLTNQGIYQLRVDLQLSDGSSFYVTYDGFRISDEWGEYSVVELEEYHSYGSDVVTSCPRHMVYGNCTCQGSCEQPKGSDCSRDCELGTEGCFCLTGFLMNGDECIPLRECPCFWPDANQVVSNDQSYVNDHDDDCTERRSCTNNSLARGKEYQCDADARCVVKDGVRQCYCNDGLEGDGQNCEPLYTDCYDVYNDGQIQDGVYLIKPTNWRETAFNVSCVMSTNSGGWTVFLRRTGTDRQTNFYRDWSSYQEGFGSLAGDFWLGNEKLYYLTQQRQYEMRVDMRLSDNSPTYAEYSTFSIGTVGDKYRLTVSGFSGNSGTDSMYQNNGKAFTTHDRDNDECRLYNCAVMHRGGWWHSNHWCAPNGHYLCRHLAYGGSTSLCTQSSPNGEYNGGNGENIFWDRNRHRDEDCNLNFVEMKIRPSG